MEVKTVRFDIGAERRFVDVDDFMVRRKRGYEKGNKQVKRRKSYMVRGQIRKGVRNGRRKQKGRMRRQKVTEKKATKTQE